MDKQHLQMHSPLSLHLLSHLAHKRLLSWARRWHRQPRRLQNLRHLASRLSVSPLPQLHSDKAFQRPRLVDLVLSPQRPRPRLGSLRSGLVQLDNRKLHNPRTRQHPPNLQTARRRTRVWRKMAQLWTASVSVH